MCPSPQPNPQNSLPQTFPVTSATFNYAPIMLIVTLGGAGLSWVLSGRHWFTGPGCNGRALEGGDATAVVLDTPAAEKESVVVMI